MNKTRKSTRVKGVIYCPKCNSERIILIDHESLSASMEYTEEGVNIDNEIFGKCRCCECSHTFSVHGTINWVCPERIKDTPYKEREKKSKMCSDLKFVLVDVFCGESPIKLTKPIEFKFNPELNTGIKMIDQFSTHTIEYVYKRGLSWRMCDEFGNEWTISRLPSKWQDALYSALLSMRDTRVVFENGELEL